MRALARVNLAAIERNCGRLLGALPERSALAAVVKADAYGHGAVPAARAALAGGASWLAVAAAEEATELRHAGIDARLLVMGALSPEELEVALDADADVVAWREDFVAGVSARGSGRVHVKLDTGMGRLGTRDPAEATRVLEAVNRASGLTAAGLMTHFATADDRQDAFFAEQLGRFAAWANPLKQVAPDLVCHAANSAAVLRDPASHFDLARCGVGIYGLDPFGEDAAARELEAALELHTYVAEVKPCAPGQSTGYGRTFIAREPTTLGILPIGYGDGWRRALSNDADALIAGRRHALVGTVSMDNVAVNLGSEPEITVGSPAVLIGRQGSELISAEEVARRLQTINYEVTCGLLPRARRWYHRDGRPQDGLA
ncbi:MAG TPA: alanine racemase [Solirubrobacteraceae bacterium]|nr:alanine racemase [Solirubrobacteraceae bacterium]